MAVLTNTMLQGSSAVTEEEAYQIEKSVRVDDSGTSAGYLSKTFEQEGSRSTWTFATWFKLADRGDDRTIFSAGTGGSRSYIFIDGSTDNLEFHAGGSIIRVTHRQFADPSAWYHLVVTLDTTNHTTNERCKIWVNGSKDFAWGGFSTNTGISIAWDGSEIGDNVLHHIGKNTESGTTDEFDGQFADMHFIEGLALGPANFGYFDDNEVWQPRSFRLLDHNDGTTFSSGSKTGTVYGSDDDHENAFNDIKTGTGTSWLAANDSDSTLTLPGGGIKFKQGVRIYGAKAASAAHATVTIDGVVHKVASGTGDAWTNVYEGTGTLTALSVNSTGSNRSSIAAVEVDGVELRDATTDPTWDAWSAVNRGVKWSDYLTNSVGFQSGAYDARAAFNRQKFTANTFSANTGSGGSTFTFTPPVPITVASSIELGAGSGGSAAECTYTLNGGSSVAFGDGTGAYQKKVISGAVTLTSITVTCAEPARLYYIKIDGVQLLDSNVNSFHLKYNDVTADRTLGYSQVMNTPTGAQPMYGPGADDASKSSLVFAMPGYDLNDHHHTIKGSGSAKTVTVQADATTSSTKTKLYDKALKFDGTGDYLEVADGTDWDFGTGDFTVELWVYPTNTSGYVGIIGSRDSSGWGLMYAPADSYKLKFYTPTERASGANGLVVNKWQHVAVSRSGTTIKAFVNGAQVISATDSSTADGDASLKIGTGWPSGMSNLNGYLADIRIYKANAKYTSAFIPPVRPDFTPNNIYAAAAPVSANFYHDDSNTSFDGNSPSGNLSGVTLNAAVSPVTYTNNTGYGSNQNGVSAVFAPSGQSGGRADFKLIGNNQVWLASSTDNGASWSGTGEKRQIYEGGDDYEYTFTNKSAVAWAGGSSDNWVTVTITNPTVAGIGNDTSTDSPTNYAPEVGSDATGGVTRGNYCTFNPWICNSNISLSQNGLYIKGNNAHAAACGTLGIPRYGKWYFEMTRESDSNEPMIGVKGSTLPHATLINSNVGNPGFFVRGNEARYMDGSEYAGGWMAGFTQNKGQTIGVAIDMDHGAFYARKPNGDWQNSGDPTSGSSKTGSLWSTLLTDIGEGDVWLPCVKVYDSGLTASVNFGQRPFVLGSGAPTGYKCLCTTNLEDILVSGDEKNNPHKYFTTKLYSGTGASQDIKADSAINPSFGKIDFGPDLIMVKEYGGTGKIQVYDQARGTGKRLETQESDAEASQSGGVNAFLSNGWTQGDAGSMNNSGDAYIAWLWDAGSAAATASTEGGITPTAQWVNNTSGFSITKWTGNNATTTVGHGLSEAPTFILHKITGSGGNWNVFHEDIGSGHRMVLNEDQDKDTGYWNSAIPTNTVWSMTGSINENTHSHVAYSWVPIPGYSKFGLYSGNGLTSGMFVYTGFLPRLIWIKEVGSNEWFIKDTRIAKYNDSSVTLRLNSNDAQFYGAAHAIDIFSNGFKFDIDAADYNDGSSDYIYMAWADQPLKTTRAR